MARTSQEVTQSEGVAFELWCAENNVILDGSAEGKANGALIRANFIEGNWLEDITKESLDKYHDLLRPHLKYYSENRKAINASWSQMTLAEQKVFSDYWKVDRQLEDSEFNLAIILGWIKGHDLAVTDGHISRAVEMLRDKLQWKYTSTFQSRVPQEVKDAHTKPGSFISDANKSPQQYKKENDDALAKARGDKTSQQSREVNEAQREAESLKGRTHADTERIQSRFDANKDGSINWVSTLRLRKLEQQAQERARQLVRR